MKENRRFRERQLQERRKQDYHEALDRDRAYFVQVLADHAVQVEADKQRYRENREVLFLWGFYFFLPGITPQQER